MRIIQYKPNSKTTAELLAFIQKKYGEEINFNYFQFDYKKAYEYCLNNANIIFIPFACNSKEGLVAHIALIIDKRLPKTEALFGFFESPDDPLLVNNLWKKITKCAKDRGVNLLKGPINGSIWHQYRCLKYTNTSQAFNSEPLSESYYYALLTRLKPSAEITYYSASREKFNNIMPKINNGFTELEKSGFKIEELDNVSLEQLRKLGDISRKVFSKNSWGYTELTENEFLKLYSVEKLNLHLNKLYLLYKDDTIIGYCGTSIDNPNVMIIKTICILSEYQGLGLGNALAFKIHMDALEQGFKKVIYALIREDNQIKNFPKDDTIVFRKYAAFEFKI